MLTRPPDGRLGDTWIGGQPLCADSCTERPSVKVGCLVPAMPPANDKITITGANQPKRSPAFTRWIQAKWLALDISVIYV